MYFHFERVQDSVTQNHLFYLKNKMFDAVQNEDFSSFLHVQNLLFMHSLYLYQEAIPISFMLIKCRNKNQFFVFKDNESSFDLQMNP